MFIVSQIALIVAIGLAPVQMHGNVDQIAGWSGSGCAGIAICATV